MKIRNSFVSNSSSTSFVLAISPAIKDGKEECPYCYRKSHLLEAFENPIARYEETHIISKDMNTILNWIKEKSEDWYAKERVDKALEQIGFLELLGWTFILAKKSYYDEVTGYILDTEVRNGNAKIIFSGE